MRQSPAQKINITMRSDLLARVNEYADQNGMTRSGLIAIAVTQYLNAVEAMPSVNRLLNAMAAVTDGVLTGDLPESEAKARMDAITATYEALTKKQ